MKKHSIELSKEQRQELEAMVRSGKTDARSIQHAHILLHSDNNLPGRKFTLLKRME